MKSKESYAHHYAKQIMQEWLENKWIYCKDTYREHATLGVLDWTVDCSYGPGIKQEYPLIKTKSGAILGLCAEWAVYPSLLKNDLIEREQTIEMVFDLVVSDMGVPKYGIEIVHKHLCGIHKRQTIKSFRPKFKVYEISAEWILSQLINKIPLNLPFIEIL